MTDTTKPRPGTKAYQDSITGEVHWFTDDEFALRDGIRWKAVPEDADEGDEADDSMEASER